jgi:hypothetical protein
MKLTPTGKEQTHNSKRESGSNLKSGARSDAQSDDPRRVAIAAALDLWEELSEESRDTLAECAKNVLP